MAEGKIKNPTPSATTVRVLVSGDNLNDIYGNLLTACYITSGVINSPDSWVWLLVLGGTGTTQVIFAPNYIKIRSYTGSPIAWTQWRTVNLS